MFLKFVFLQKTLVKRFLHNPGRAITDFCVSEAKRWLHTDRVFTACLTPLRARWGSLITESPALLSVLPPHASAATPAPFRTASTSARENSSHSCSSVIRGLAAARGQRSHTAEFMFTLACRIFRITLEGGGEKKQHLIESAFLGSKWGISIETRDTRNLKAADLWKRPWLIVNEQKNT